MNPPVHERTSDGRDRHYMTKKDGVWVCECGETRNQYGDPTALQAATR